MRKDSLPFCTFITLRCNVSHGYSQKYYISNFVYCFYFVSLIGLWWIILLRAYGKLTGDYSMQERVDVQTGLKMILQLCLTDGFDMFPSLLVTDGSCMIDRRMGIHGHPLEIQVSITMLCFLDLLCFALSDMFV